SYAPPTGTSPTRYSAVCHCAPKDTVDLHVLGTPPAFTLSQDQTLHHECTSSLSLFETFFLRISLKRNQVLCSTTNGLLDRQRCTYGGLVHTSRCYSFFFLWHVLSSTEKPFVQLLEQMSLLHSALVQVL